MFIFRNSNPRDCNYFYEETDGHFNGDDEINFNDEIKGIDNPIVIKIEGERYKVRKMYMYCNLPSKYPPIK